MKNKFKILERGNFYFPVIDKGQKFVVEDTIDIKLEKKCNKLVQFSIKNKTEIFFGELGVLIWEALKKEIDLSNYKNYWFVPIRLCKLGDNYVCSIDVLKKVK